jgi:hypothetical protein
VRQKPIDLSVRPPAQRGQPIPTFRRQNRVVNSASIATAGSSLTLFAPDAACTVQWIIVQTTNACTIQQMLNGQPFGVAIAVGAGAVIRFAGTYLVSNEQIALMVSAATTLSYELVWTKDFSYDYMVTETAIIYAGTGGAFSAVNVSQWDGVTVSPATTDAPVGTEAAPVVRDIFRKKQALLTNTLLGVSGVFTSAWFDTELDGSMAVFLAWAASVVCSACVIQESEDQINTVNAQSNTNLAIGQIAGFIRARYWRVVYTNSATAQTGTFTLYATTTSLPYPGSQFAGNVNEPTVIASSIGGAGTFSDGQTVASRASIANVAGSAGTQQNVVVAFNGSTLDRVRNNQNTTTGDTGAKTASFNGATQTSYEGWGALITILLGTVSGTTPTLTAQLQWSPDGAGTTWLNIGPALTALTATGQTGLFIVLPANVSQTSGATPANLTTGATQQVILNCPLPRTWRLVYTIGGTTPSFAITAVYVNYMKA